MKNLFTLVLSFTIMASFAINPLWQKIGNKNLQLQGERKIIPQQTNVVKLNDAAFRTLQLTIPTEASGQSKMIDLPTPDGTLKSFKVFERTTMEQELADRYQMIKTYEAICVENPAVTAKLDYTPFGFHAMVFDNDKTYFIDPYTNINTGYYNCYYKKGYTRTQLNRQPCGTIGKPTIVTDYDNSANRVTTPNNGVTNISSTGIKRTFRLALACTIEYSAAVGGPTPTKASVLAAMVTSVNRINGVYEKELSIHMNLVARNDTLIFITSDSYINDDGGTMLGQNQTICNNRIGNANYDIGHVFSTGGGGVAYLGVVCDNADKAKGVTGLDDPTGDAYDIDYVAHEMGHQFGGNHTFNAVSGSCSGNRESGVAYEVGSGTTIMAYAGICNNNNPQPHSDDYFHRASLNEIYTYISSTSCAVTSNAGNAAPTVSSYVSTYTIPYKTSFEISAAATDPNGHPINYCWEEWDLGPQGNWNGANNTRAPILRSFLPSVSATRTFPMYDSLIKNSIKYLGEVLPETARDTKFRCTVRNINTDGYGAFNAPEENLTVKSVVTTDLFRVTSFPAASTFNGGTQQTINWNVAATTAAPVSCANINIYLSLDSARTFPYILAANTPNDGSQIVTIPNVITNNASARIKVKGSGNIFFDLNDGWIKINQGVIPVVASFTPGDTAICSGSSLTFTNTSTGTPDSVRWTISGGTPSTSTSLTTVTAAFSTAGFYTISLIAYKDGTASTISKVVQVKPTPTVVFTPASPITICSGDSVTITAAYIAGATCMWSTGSPNQTITVKPTANTYYSVTVTNDGCSAKDSILVNVNPTSTIAVTASICNGETITVAGQQFSTVQVNRRIVLTNSNSLGCDSIIILNLSIKQKTTTSISQTICEGQSVTVGGQIFTTTQTNTQIILTNSQGCDSTITLNLNVIPKTTATITQTICEGQSFTVGGQTFSNPQVNKLIVLLFGNSQGCDSIITLNLTIAPKPVTNISQTICQGEVVAVGSEIFSTEGLHTVVLQSALGCDSTINLTLMVNPTVSVALNQTICEDDTITIGTQSFTEQGNYSIVLQTSTGCDSTVNLNLTVIPAKINSYGATICYGDSLVIGNQAFSTVGLHSVLFQSADGCDSIVTVNIGITYPDRPTLTLVGDSLVTGEGFGTYRWYLNGVFIESTTSPTYKPTQSGSWSVDFYNGCLTPRSAAVNVVITGIKNNKLDISIAIIPNPNNGQFDIKITSPKNDKYSVSMYNVTGQEIIKNEMNIQTGVNVKRFTLDHIEKGVYFIAITGKDGVTTQNIIVQ